MHLLACLLAYLPSYLANYVPTCLPEYCVTIQAIGHTCSPTVLITVRTYIRARTDSLSAF